VCTGSTTPRDIRIPNRDVKGICFAMEFLEKSQRRRAGDNVSWEGLDPAGKRVSIFTVLNISTIYYVIIAFFR
jgi:NADPH-dependent glutamate synthase beta subunit-like oxidoreductase